MGSKEGDKYSDDDERPQFEYSIPNNYYMARYPVTNAQFEAFVAAPQGYTNDVWWTEAGIKWRKDRKEHNRFGGAFALANHPVVGVTWYEAHAFTKWATNKLKGEGGRLQVWVKGKIEDVQIGDGFEIRLPTEAEWERAARGGHQNIFPWGTDEITSNRANYDDTQIGATSAVGAFPLGMNKFGLLDMSGNVREWCATAWQDNYAEYLSKENNEPEGSPARVLRGGSFFFNDWDVRCADRFWFVPDLRYSHHGFRVVVSVSHFS
jgi:formylglycine-generating enzyme required for sulfatase activity